MKRGVSLICSLVMVLQLLLGSITVWADEQGSENAGDDSSQTTYTEPESPSVTYNMNVDWKFIKASSGSEYPLAKASESVKKNGKDFYEVDYDDSDWETVSVPHPINAEDSFDGNAYDAGEASLYRGFMFYRKHVTIPSSDAGKKMFLEFEAVRQSVYLYVNGQMVGYYEAGVAATGFDITDYVKAGEDNVIAVATDNASDRGQSDSTKVTHETKPGSTPGAADGYGYQWNTKDFNEVQGGITGNVNLYAKGKIYQTLPLYNNLKTTGNYIYGSDYDIENKSATINVKAEVRNESEVSADLTLQVDVVDMQGNLAYTFEKDATVKAADDAGQIYKNMVPEDAYEDEPVATDISTVDVSYIEASFNATNMRFWSDTDPYLYTVYTILKDENENIIDVQKTTTGFRKVEYDINNGLRINDKTTYLKGYAQRSTDEWAVIGVANDWLNDIDMSLVRESNANFIRWMHVAPKPVEIRSGDKYGVISVCPAGDKEGDVDGRQWDQRVEAMRDAIIYFRNSPSVIFWEAGNNAVSADHMQEMTDLKNNLDPDGGRFMGSRTISSVEQIKAAEYAGTMLNRHASTAKASMASAGGKYMPIIETEYARDEAPRRVWDDYSPPDYDYVNKWLGASGSKTDGYDIWDETSEDFSVANAKAYDEFWSGRVTGGGDEYYAGAAIMVWSDSNMHTRNTYSENCRTSGKVDAVRIKKDAFYALQAVQSSEPKIHIVGHWNYPEYTKSDENGNYWYEDKTWDGMSWNPNGTMLQRDPTKKTVYVIGSPDISKVELYINDELAGTDLKPDSSFVYAFNDIDVTQSGEVKAIAYDESDIAVAEDIIKTAGDANRIKLTPVTGPDGLVADGSDIMYFDVEVVDEDGNVCPLNYDRIDLSLSGEGVLLGGYNSGTGDKITTGKNYVYAECGVNRVFVKSTRDAGTFTLTASMDGLGSFTSTVTSVAYDNTVTGGTGLSTQMQKTYSLGEQPEEVEQKVEAYKPLAAAVTADFSEDGNTKIAEDIDTTDYYTVTVNGKEVQFGEKPYAPKGASVVSEVAPVLDALRAAGADIEYTYQKDGEKPSYVTAGTLPVISVTSGINPTSTIEGGAALTQFDIANGYTTVILNQGADQNLMDAQAEITTAGELKSELKVMLGYLEGVSIEQDEVNKVYKITYTEPEIGKTSLTYNDGKVEVLSESDINNATLIFTAYDDNNIPVKISTQRVSVSANTSKAIDVPSDIAASGTTRKAMLWRSLITMKPICDAIELSSSASAETSSVSLMSAPVTLSDVSYEVSQYSENYNTNTQTDGPDGTGYLQTTTNTKIFENMGTVLKSESLISLDFRFDNTSGTMSIKNGADSGGKWGPNFSFDGTNFRTQTGGTSYQTLGAISVGSWYHLEIEGKMGVANASAVCRLYKWENGEKTLVQETASLNLRNLASASNGAADYMISFGGISFDNVSVTSLYANEVAVSATSSEINANESVLLSATATRNGSAVTVPEFKWSLYDANGNQLNDSTISIDENGNLTTTAATQSQTIKVRATAQTQGNPYGEKAITINGIDTSNDTFNAITLSSDKEYVRLGSDTTITPTVTMDGTAVTPASSDIVWKVYNEANVREVKNIGITVTNGVVSVDENVLPQTITIRASNKSGSASASIQLAIKPGTMILDGEMGNKDTFVSGNACEELVTGLNLQEGSWDGTGYYKLTSAYDFTGFASDTSEHVVYSADMRFDADGAGWTIWNSSKGKQGLQVISTGGKLGIVKDGSTTNKYCDIDSTSWYNVQIMCSTGNDNAYANLIVYKYVDGKKVNPVTGEENVPYVAEGITMRNLSASTANHVAIAAGTSVDNVYCAKTTPDNIEVSADKTTLFAGQSIQGSVTATRNGVAFGYISSNLIKWNVYDENNEKPLGSDLITVDSTGKLTVDALADAQTINLRASTVDGSLYDSVKITIQSSDIFTVQTLGFNDDYSKLVELDVVKNFAYSDAVTFAVCTYDENGSMTSITTKKMSGKNIEKSEDATAVSIDVDIPSDFDKEKDTLIVYTLTSISENEAVTEDDGTIGATLTSGDNGYTLSLTNKPAFDASQKVFVLVVKPDTATTNVKDSDVLFFKQYTGAEIAQLESVKIAGNLSAGDYIIKMAGKINGISTIATAVKTIAQ